MDESARSLQSAINPMTVQPSASSPIFQTTVLTPGMVDTLIMDDSPDILFDKFWQFLGVDIPVADIKEWDFKNILDFVDLQFINMQQEYRESDWENIAIVEYEKREEPVIDKKTGKAVVDDETNEVKTQTVMIPKKVYKIVELWDALRGKIYLKMCRAREGFTLRELTENRQSIEERLHTSSTGMPTEPVGPGMMQGPGLEQKKKSRWGIW